MSDGAQVRSPNICLLRQIDGRASAPAGQFDAAVAYLRRAIAARPDFGGGHFNLANSLASQGQFELAARHYRRTLELHPEMQAARGLPRFASVLDCGADCEQLVESVTEPELEGTMGGEKEVLVVASKLKAYIREASGMNTSANVMLAISDIIRQACDQAI